jgi:hypothetical protein
MALFESLLALLLVAILLLKISGHVGVPYPTMLAFAGACVAGLPWVPEIDMQPRRPRAFLRDLGNRRLRPQCARVPVDGTAGAEDPRAARQREVMGGYLVRRDGSHGRDRRPHHLGDDGDADTSPVSAKRCVAIDDDTRGCADAFHRLEEELDWAELHASPREELELLDT